jgi:hypothetical protein
MARLELTDKPCPTCGKSLDLYLESRKPDDDKDPQRTAKVMRVLRCPECAYEREDGPCVIG